MRSRLLAATALLLAGSLLAAPGYAGPAHAAPMEPAAAELPERAADRATRALEEARALFTGRSGLRARPRAATEGTGREATLVLAELAETLPDLDPEDRQLARELLARPTDPSGGAVGERYTAPEATPYCDDMICVHYVTRTADAPSLADADADGVPDYVERTLTTARQVHDTYASSGYRRPVSDDLAGGDRDKVDLYISDLGAYGLFGYCATDDPMPTRRAAAYCSVDNDYDPAQFGTTSSPVEFLRVTVAHEYFHAVQFAYDVFEDAWFMEATATWVEDEIFDDVDDNRYYLPAGQLGRPDLPLDEFLGGSGAPYGQWIFFRYLTERWTDQQGALPRIVLDATRLTEGERYSLPALRQVLADRGTTFPATYAAFADVNRRPAREYEEGSAYRAAAPYRRHVLTGGTRSSGQRGLTQDHLTTRTIRFVPGSGTDATAWKLRLNVNMADKVRGSTARATVYWRSGDITRSVVPLGRLGNGSLTTRFSRQKVRFVELTLVNASTRYAGCWSGDWTYACEGRSRDDGLRQVYRGTAFR